MGTRNIKLRQHYTAYQRWRLHNTNITLISSNCTGGCILRDLNLPFTSPFINLFIKPHDFIKLCENLEHYMGSAFHDVYSEPHPEGGVYPVALLDDIPIHFMHYSSAEEAFAQWEKRKARMDWDNIYILCTDRDGCTYEDLLRFDQLKYRHKAILCNQKYPEIQSAFYIPGFENQNSVGNITNYINDHTYKKYYDLFDYVGWFNGKLDRQRERAFVPPAGGMKFLLDFFTKKSRGSRGRSPWRCPRGPGFQRAAPFGARCGGEPREEKDMQQMGLVHIYCGNGKGKTTAAMGLALRAAGRGLPVVVAQFLKDGESGECQMLRQLPGVTVIAGNPCGKFSFQMCQEERDQTACCLTQLFREAVQKAKSPGLLVLDEICAALSGGFLQEDEVLGFLQAKPAELEVVMTGREPPERICEMADYISEIMKRRHPYDKGVPARVGIEK